MKATFLGTGTSQGVPVIACHCEVCQSLDFRNKRLRTSLHVQSENTDIVIDTGPDFRQQILRERIESLDAIVFTHEHKDHTAGMDDVRAFNFKQKMDMPLYAEARVIDQLKMEFSYVFSQSTYPGVPRVNPQLINDTKSFKIGDIELTPIRVMHYKLPVLGFRMGMLTYITDANYIDPSEKDKIRGSEVLIINALQKQDHISHFNLKEAIDLAEEIGAKTTYLTHISHQMGLHADVEKELPNGIIPAHDGLSIQF